MKYCKFCGAQLFDEAVICPNCHNNISVNHKLIVKRESFVFIGANKKPLIIEINGEIKGQIFNEEELVVDLADGIYNMVIYYMSRKRKRGVKTITVDLCRDVKFNVSYNNIVSDLQILENIN